jgi:hypothetical protein
VGYMFIEIDKEWYRPGEVIEGRVYFEFFIPSFQTSLMIKIEGKETFPREYYEKAFEEVIKES